MPSVATGAMLANRNMLGLGVTGDGDTASIGIGQFMHLVRRNLPMIYIIEDNGVYGLTKGQFSATADLGSKLKTGVINDLPPVRLLRAGPEVGRYVCGALFLAATRSSLQAMLKAAIAHNGLVRHRRRFALRDLQRSRGLHQELQLHEGARRDAARAGFRAVLRRNFGGDPGGRRAATCELHDGSHLRIRKLDRDYDPTNRLAALTALEEAEKKGEVLTGVLYVNTAKPTFTELLNMSDEPLATMTQAQLRPSAAVLNEVMDQLR